MFQVWPDDRERRTIAVPVVTDKQEGVLMLVAVLTVVFLIYFLTRETSA